MNASTNIKPKSHKRVVIWLLGIVLLMSLYTFALIPLYNAFCKLTGINGKVDINEPLASGRYKIKQSAIPERLITVEFDVNRNQHIRCEIKPLHTALQVEPGVLTHTSYSIKNLSDKPLTLQAIPSITPGIAAKHLKKLECFCFSQQSLKPFEEITVFLRFWLEPEVPKNIYRMTLSYTLFEVQNLNKEQKSGP